MSMSVRRVIPVLILILLLVICLTSAINASVVSSESIREFQRIATQKTGDMSREGADFIEGTDDPKDDPRDGVDPKASALEVKQSVRPEENTFPLLSRDYIGQFDIPIVFNDAVDYFIRYFTVQKRKVFVNWLKRAKRYAPTIREILREQGLPEDLVYLAMIESGFNPKAYSPMKACGPWQFIYETGERYGLRVNYWVDERRDPQKSTVAAARYLKDLFNQFGCWYLAAAGYNAGEKRIERAIVKHETNDFWELRKYNTLPRETREYIPQLIAAAIIAKDPEKFGLTNIPFDAPIPSKLHRVPGGTPLSLVAKAAGFDVTLLHSLNPEILRGVTPPDADSYAVRLPVRVDGEEFGARLRAALKDGSRVLSVTGHVVKRKDSVSKIMKQYGISRSDLMLVNACGGEFSVKPGSLVYIPRFERDGEGRVIETAPRTEEAEKDQFAPSTVTEKTASNKRDHIVKRGLPDTVRRHGADAGSPGETSGLKVDRIRSNSRIALASGTGAGSSAIRKDGKKEAAGQNRVFHIVKKGENLADISEKYGTDVATLKKINKLKKDRVVPNMRLEVENSNKTQSAQRKADRASCERSRTNQTRAVQARQVKLYHVVKNGENLTDISEKYSLNVASLKKMNGLKRDGVRPGMRLKVASQ